MIPLTSPILGFAWVYDCSVYAPVVAHGLVQTEDVLHFVCTVTGPTGTFAGLTLEIDSEAVARKWLAEHDGDDADLARAALNI